MAYMLITLLIASWIVLFVIHIRLLRQTRMDAMTGAFSGQAFRSTITRLLMSGYDFAIVYIDCDNFKLLNDTRGHAAGDSVLREVVDYLRQVVRPADMIARLGGDEFAIVLRDCKNDDLGQIISRIRKFEKHGVTLSCGWSTSNETDPLSAADRRMYECKQSSR